MGFFLIFNGINSVATKYIIPTEFKITLLRMLHQNQVLKTKMKFDNEIASFLAMTLQSKIKITFPF